MKIASDIYMSMDIRKLQKTGGSSYTVTLPKQWVLSQSLGSPKQVVMTIGQQNELILQPEAMLTEISQPYKLMVNDMEDSHVFRSVLACYLSGFQTIHVFVQAHQKNTVRKAVTLLLGFEIVSESVNQMVIKNVLDTNKFSVFDHISQMFKMTHSMVADSLESLRGRNTDLAQDVVLRDREIDRLHYALIRQFRTKALGYSDTSNTDLSLQALYYYRTVAVNLERVADHAVKIAKLLPLSDKSLQFSREASSHILDLLQATKKVVADSDHVMANQLLDRNGELSEELYSVLPKPIWEHEIIVRDSLDRIRGYLINISEETIDYVISKDYLDSLVEKA